MSRFVEQNSYKARPRGKGRGPEVIQNNKGPNLIKSVSNETKQIADEVANLTKQGLFQPINEIKQDFHETTSNSMKKENEYKYIRDMGSLAGAVAIDVAKRTNNKAMISEMASPDKANINPETLENIQKTLYNSGITWQSKPSFKSYGDYERLNYNMDAYANKCGLGQYMRGNTNQLNNNIDALTQQINELKKIPTREISEAHQKELQNTVNTLTQQINDLKNGTTKMPTKKALITREKDLQNSINSLTKQINELNDKIVKMPTRESLITREKEIQNVVNMIGVKARAQPIQAKYGGPPRTNFKNIKRRFKKIMLDPVSQSEGYRGYSTLMQTKMAVKMMVKAELMQQRMTYKGAKFALGKTSNAVARTLLKSSSSSLIIAGQKLQKVNRVVGRAASLAEHGASKIINAPKNTKRFINNKKNLVKDRTRYSVEKLKNSKFYKAKRRKLQKSVVGHGYRFIKVNAHLALTFLARTKFGRRVTKIASKAFIIGNMIAGNLGLAGRALLKLVHVVIHLLKTVIMGALFALGGATIAGLLISMMITSLTMIMSAVSNSYDEFKENTTMGKAYEALLEKENEFNTAVTNLKATIKPPNKEIYTNAEIKEYSNVNVHYIGADGLEISWSGAIGDFNINPNEVSDRIVKHLKRYGWTDVSIAGFLGNVQQESSFQVAQTEFGHDDGSATMLGSGFGLCQWTNTGGNSRGRRYRLFEYAASKGMPASDIETQLDFMMFGEGSDSRLARQFGKTQFSSPAAAAEFFCNKWERPNAAMSHLADVRIPAAEKFYVRYGNDPFYDSITPDLEGKIEEFEVIENNNLVTSNFSQTTTSTIKGILAMAAIYIDQDFNKYGSLWDAGSVYKDYCASLYRSSHIIGIDETDPKIYYCPAYSPNESEPEFRVASSTCNNILKGGTSISDWLTDNFSLRISQEEDSYEVEDEDIDGYDAEGNPIYKITHSTETYTKTIIEKAGPHGTFEFDSGSYDYAMSAMKEMGCEHYHKFITYKDDSTETCVLACCCDECRGHVDADAYVFVSNIYDPSVSKAMNGSSMTAPEEEEGDRIEEDGESTQTNNSVPGKDVNASFKNAEKTEQEYKYNMYVLDKYATAFDAPKPEIEYKNFCTNKACNGSLGLGDEHTEICPLCDSPVTQEAPAPNKGRVGDQTSIDKANETKYLDAEKKILEELTEHPMTIIDWWDDKNWFTDDEHTPEEKRTYYRLGNFEESIDTLKPDPDNNDGDKNIINAGNSSPYWFKSKINTGNRNLRFEQTGWNKSNIFLVNMLLAADWEELYGIKDFGFVQGSPMTEAQIAQLLANSPEWESLCDDRKTIIANTILFNKEAARLNIPYHQSTPIVKTMAELQAAQNMSQVALANCASKPDHGRGIDCSAYVGFILYNSGLYDVSRPSTSSIRSEIGTKFDEIPGTSLLPGDIILSRSGAHVMLYMGNGKVSEASGHNKRLVDTFNHTKNNLFAEGNKYLRLKSIDEQKHTLKLTDLTNGLYQK